MPREVYVLTSYVRLSLVIHLFMWKLARVKAHRGVVRAMGRGGSPEPRIENEFDPYDEETSTSKQLLLYG